VSRARSLTGLIGPVGLLVLAGIVGSLVSNARSIEFTDAIVAAATVIALYIFVGNSGVLSFGQIGFFIVGAYAAGELTVPADARQGVLPNVFSLIKEHTVGNPWSLVIAAAAGGLYALVVGLPLMRLSGLAAGIATFAVLEITHNIVRNWEKIGPGPLTLSTVPETTDLWQATLGAIAVACVAFAYQRSRLGR
jgi:branched-chain amino acid transport system permease protein